MVKFIWEFQAVGPGVEFWVMVEVSTGVPAYITKSPQILVTLGLSPAKVEEVKWNLSMRQLCPSIFEKGVCRLPQIHPFSSLFGCLTSSGRLKLLVAQDHLWHLEEYHLTANMLDNIVRALKSRNEATLTSMSPRKVLRHIVEQANYEIITVLKVHQKIVRLWHKHVFCICTNHHLGLFQSRLEVVKVHVVVVR